MKPLTNLLKGQFYLTDGGLETTLIFHEGIELNHFAAFELLNDAVGRAVLCNYYEKYLDLALRFNTGFILEGPTWRANKDWGFKLGYSNKELGEINRLSIHFLRQLQSKRRYSTIQMLVSGAIGPRGDGYIATSCMDATEAKEYHIDQISAFADAGADLATAFTLNYINEAIGIVLAAKSLGMPVVVSFTVETDGRLPDGESLRDAIERTDAATNNHASYYMINCAHPEHFIETLKTGSEWKNRIYGIRANASTKSHKALDESETLDSGDTCKLAEGYRQLLQLLPNLRVIGGCCGTDHSHIEEVSTLLFDKAEFAAYNV